VDATSLGETVVEDLRDMGVEGYKFTGTQAKQDLMHGLVRALNEHRVVIPFQRELIAELGNYQYDITPSKVIRMEAKQGHDDYVTSLALSNYLASQPLYTGFFMGGFDGFGRKSETLPKDFDPFANLDADLAVTGSI
jgi:hypothetical protein